MTWWRKTIQPLGLCMGVGRREKRLGNTRLIVLRGRETSNDHQFLLHIT